MIKFRASLLFLFPVVALAAGGIASCDSMGTISDSPRGGAGTTGAAGTGGLPPTGAAGDGTTGSGTGAAGSGSVAGAAGTTGSGMGAAGSGTGAAGTGSGAGAAGTGSGVAGTTGGGTGAAGTSGGAGTGAAGRAGAAGTTGAAGRAGAAGTTGAAGTGAAGAGAAGTGAAGAGTAGTTAVMMPHCKRGVAYQSNSLGDLQAFSKGVSWWYNWSTAPEKSAAGWEATGVEFVPMVWGYDPDVAAIVKQIPVGAKYILGFNEPNFGAQSNITAQVAAQRWPKIMEIARQRNLKIGSPSPQYCAGNCNDTDPFHWLDAFFAACPGCQVDFMATHWYACTGDALKNHLSKFKKYGRPIWVTEFSCMDAGDHSAAGEQAYMKTALQILENDPMVFRYSWFTGRWPALPGISLLGGASGALTDLGNLYVTSAATSVCSP